VLDIGEGGEESGIVIDRHDGESESGCGESVAPASTGQVERRAYRGTRQESRFVLAEESRGWAGPMAVVPSGVRQV